MNIYVVVSLQHEATHSWPECPFEDVAFLRNEHRHIFHIKVVRQVKHTDRDIEIIRLKRQIKKYLYVKKGKSLGRSSCEDLAIELLREFGLVSCEVLEDGENGAIVRA